MSRRRPAPDLAHVDTWVFDLDNTLYPAACDLFAQVDVRMRTFIQNLLGLGETEARALQKGYFLSHGTTLKGLMDNHGIAPEAFLEFVHDIDVTPVPPNPKLAGILERLPGRKLVFTNGSVSHAENVMTRLGVGHCFEGVFDIVHSDYVPKREIAPWHSFVRAHAVEPSSTAMFEDMAKNLIPAHDLGMTTVWIPNGNAWSSDAAEGAHIHHVTEDLTGFLDAALAEIGTGKTTTA